MPGRIILHPEVTYADGRLLSSDGGDVVLRDWMTFWMQFTPVEVDLVYLPSDFAIPLYRSLRVYSFSIRGGQLSVEDELQSPKVSTTKGLENYNWLSEVESSITSIHRIPAFLPSNFTPELIKRFRDEFPTVERLLRFERRKPTDSFYACVKLFMNNLTVPTTFDDWLLARAWDDPSQTESYIQLQGVSSSQALLFGQHYFSLYEEEAPKYYRNELREHRKTKYWPNLVILSSLCFDPILKHTQDSNDFWP